MLCLFHRTYNRWIGGVLNKKQNIVKAAACLNARPGSEDTPAFQITRELSKRYFYLTGEIDFTVKEKQKAYEKSKKTS